MQSVDLKKRRRAVKIANAVNSIPASESSKLLSDRWSNGEITTEQMKTELLVKYKTSIVQ